MSGAAQPSWKPPDADRQPSGWSPPQSDREPPSEQGFLKSFGEWAIKPMADLTAAIGTANVLDYMRAGQSISDFGNMLRGEPRRIWNELAHVGTVMASGDITNADAGRHLAGAVPMLGPAAVQVSEEIGQGRYRDAAGHYLALLAPGVAERSLPMAGAAIRALPEAPAVIGRAAEAARAGAQAAAPDVAWGAAKAAAGYGIGEMLPGGGGPLKYAVELPSVYKGARQVGRGLKKGVAAARASFAETALPEAPAAPEAPATTPTGPVTGPTDEALVHLYSVETDPVKRSALQSELINRGLMKEPAEAGAAVATEANPYRTYSQKALQDTYAIEQNPQKRALMEQAARDRNLSLLSREGRRATATVPETGFVEPRGPSLTQDEALMLRHLGIEDPLFADTQTIATARQLAAENPELMNRLRTGTFGEAPAPTPPPAAAPATPTPAPAAPPPAAAAPAAPETAPLAGKPRAAEIAAQLEASTRPDRMLEFLKKVDPNIAPEDLDKFGPHDWELAANGAGSPSGTVPTPKDIQQIRADLAESVGAKQINGKTSAEATAEFQQKHAIRNKRKPPATATEAAPAATPPAPISEPRSASPAATAPADLESQLAQSLETVKAGKRPTALTAPEAPAALTQSQKRVERFAQHLAGDESATIANLETMPDNPNALGQLEGLGRSLDIKGRPKAEEIPQIIERVKQLRSEKPATPEQPQNLRTLMEGKTLAGAAPEIQPHVARQILDEEMDLPEGWYVHGRSRGSKVSEHWPVQLTQDIRTATGYAGEEGSVWAVREKPHTRVADFTSTDSVDMNKFIKSLRQEFKRRSPAVEAYRQAIADSRGVTSDAIKFNDFAEHVRDDFTPSRIVHSAQAFDNDLALNLLQHYPGGWPSFIKTPDGAVVIPGEFGNVQSLNLTELAKKTPPR